MTPLMKQWTDAKAANPPGALIAIRLGDFYEFFFDDATAVAKALQLTLTCRRDVPMCGVPFHALDRNIEALAAAGFRVVISEYASVCNPLPTGK